MALADADQATESDESDAEVEEAVVEPPVDTRGLRRCVAFALTPITTWFKHTHSHAAVLATMQSSVPP